MRLDIYIAEHCFGCQEALNIAEQARNIAKLIVRVINLDAGNEMAPPQVVAVPTYLLNGQVISLGNPRREPFLAQLRHEVEEYTK